METSTLGTHILRNWMNYVNEVATMVNNGAEKGMDDCLHTLKHGMQWGTMNE
jgi:hypothetical protein